MKRKHVLGLAGALLLLLLEWFSLPFLLSGVSTFVRYVFYGPSLLGEHVLVFMRENLGVPIPAGTREPLSYGWNVALLLFNWCCYAALGFLAGLKLGGVFWKER